MIRKILMPAVAMALLGGCVTPYPAYQYSGGSGDYYYGQPYIEYRDYGGYYGGLGYGHPYGWYGSIGFGGYYGYPYYGYPYHYYGYPYYHGWYGGWPYYNYRYYPNHPPVHRPGGGHDGDDDGAREDRPEPPWRSIDDLRPRHGGENPPRTTTAVPLRPTMGTPSRPLVQPTPTGPVAPRSPVMQPPRRESPTPMARPTRQTQERDSSRGSEP